MNATESVQRVHVLAARAMGATRWGYQAGAYSAGGHARAGMRATVFGNACARLISAEMLIGFGKGWAVRWPNTQGDR